MKRMKLISCLIVFFSVMMIMPSVAKAADKVVLGATIIAVESATSQVEKYTYLVLTVEASREDSQVIFYVEVPDPDMMAALAVAMPIPLLLRKAGVDLTIGEIGEKYPILKGFRIGLALPPLEPK